MKYKKSIFIFRRDHRIPDNIGLIEALKSSEKVIPIFILTPEQLKNNTYKSDNCVQFMMESLTELNSALTQYKSKLLFFQGTQPDVINKLLKDDDQIEAVFMNVDYSPYAVKRDTDIKEVCESTVRDDPDTEDGTIQVDCNGYEDYVLNPIGSITNSGGKVYSKFTPYYTSAKSKPVAKPINPTPTLLGRLMSATGLSQIKGTYKGSLGAFYEHNPKLFKNGGRSHALEILANLNSFKDYNKKRDFLGYNTTHLSAYLKFGCISIREAYHAFKAKLGPSNDLIKQLYWRDFYHNITWGFPHVIGGPMKEQYSKLEWDNNPTLFNKWKSGETGYPIVDAAMRSMNETGFMHNRARMIVSSFLIKILLVDWMKGEKYFAQTLYDYDIHNNNGGWQWSASTGADSQPYFRIFNPWLQSEKYDADAEYIKKWIPELAEVPAKHLHQWHKYHEEYPKVKYPAPIVDYATNKEISLKRYKKI
jgi:deoxyribodipyrimidine photo-lyase